MDFRIEDAAATGELRAVQGSLVLPLGIGLALWRPEGAHWLRALGPCFPGLVTGRLASLLLDGATGWNAAPLVLEGATAAAPLMSGRRRLPAD